MNSYPAPIAPSPDYAQLLKDRVALITGGGAGIGGSISRVFAKAGAKVVIVEIDADYAAAAKRDITAAGGQCHIVAGDVRESAVVKKAVAEALATFGRIDVLVNNVGHFAPYKLFIDFEEEDFDTQYQISFLHALRFTRAVLPQMIAQQSGSIIQVSSVEGQRGIPSNAVYSAYKAGLINFARSLAVEVGGHGIRVNCLAPDLTHTPATPMYDWLPDQRQVRSWAPLGRFAHPDEQADVALFLASDQSRFVTGQTIAADGGTMAASGWYRPDPEKDRWMNTPTFATGQPVIDV
jgi:2-hydroxycyclohexanecarboxyl-CoA dehydrogenase